MKPKTAGEPTQLKDCKSDAEIFTWLKEREKVIISYEAAVEQIKDAMDAAAEDMKQRSVYTLQWLESPFGHTEEYMRGGSEAVRDAQKAIRALPLQPKGGE